ncbi:MAG: hypothetical protein ACYC0V_11255 [Armatimonadota bacterium]
MKSINRKALYIMSGILILWMTLGDAILYITGSLAEGSIGLGAGDLFLLICTTLLLGIALWERIVKSDWGRQNLASRQRFLGYIVVLFGMMPFFMMKADLLRVAHIKGWDTLVYTSVMWVLFAVVLLSKIIIWAYCLRNGREILGFGDNAAGKMQNAGLPE